MRSIDDTGNKYARNALGEYLSQSPNVTIKNSQLPGLILSNSEMLGSLELTRVDGSPVSRTEIEPPGPNKLWLAPSVSGSMIRYSSHVHRISDNYSLRNKSSVRSILEGMKLLHPCPDNASLSQPKFAVKTTYTDQHQVCRFSFASYSDTFGLQRIKELFEGNTSDVVVDLPGLRLEGNATKVNAIPHGGQLDSVLRSHGPYLGTPEEVFSALTSRLTQAHGDFLITRLSPLENVEERLNRVMGLKFPIVVKPSVGCQSRGVLEVYQQNDGGFKIKTSSLHSALVLQALTQKNYPPQMVSSFSDIALMVKSPFARAIAWFRTEIGSTRTLPRVNYSAVVKDSKQLKEVLRDFYSPTEGDPIAVDTFTAEEMFKIGSVLGAPVEWRFISHSERFESGPPKIWAGFASLPDGIIPKAAALFAHGASVGGSLFRLLLVHGGVRAAMNIGSEYRRLISTVETFLESLDGYQNDLNRLNWANKLPDLAIDIAPVWNKKSKQFDYYLIELFPVKDSEVRPRVPGLFFVNPWKAVTYPPDESY